MDQKKIEKHLGKKVQLNDKSLDQVLAPEEFALISFWSAIERRGVNLKAKRDKSQGADPELDLTDEEIDQAIEEEGQRILDEFNGDARQALSSLI